jgi:hypothetical protein
MPDTLQTRPGTPWGRNRWLAVAVLLWLVSLPTGFMNLVSGFYFDPDDYGTDYYAAQVPQVVVVVLISILVPAASATASVLSIRATRGRPWQFVPATIVLLLALAGACFCLHVGIESIQRTVEFSQHAPK